MRYFIIIALLVCSCQTTEVKSNQALITPEEEQIAKNLIQGVFDDVWAGLDSTKITDYQTNDFKLLENGEVWGNEEITDYLRQRLMLKDKSKRVNSMDYIAIDKYGESIQLVYHNYADITVSDTIVHHVQWLESALAINTKEGWRLKMMHSTRVKTHK